MDVAMARRLAGESLAACIPEGVSRHIRVVWEDAVRQDAEIGRASCRERV